MSATSSTIRQIECESADSKILAYQDQESGNRPPAKTDCCNGNSRKRGIEPATKKALRELPNFMTFSVNRIESYLSTP